MRQTPLVVSVLAVALIVAAPQPAPACTCIPPGDPCAEMALSDAVFLGEVVDVASAEPEHPNQVWVTIQVATSWKGAPPSTTRLLTASNSASCGYYFQIGKRYLVYAYLVNLNPAVGDPAVVALATGLCSRTHLSTTGDPDLAALGSGCLSSIGLSAYPNPSRGPARIVWNVPSAQADARLDILDDQGRRVVTLANHPVGPGPQTTLWDGRDARGRMTPVGIYWARLACAGQVATRKLVRISNRP